MKLKELEKKLTVLRNRQDELGKLLLDTTRADFMALSTERNSNSVRMEILKQQITGKWTPIHNCPIFKIQIPN